MKTVKDVKNSPFKPLVRKYYFGKKRYGTPYFDPRGFLSTIFSIKKLKLKTKEELEAYALKYPHLKNIESTKFSNMPMVRRSKNWIKKIFNNYYYIEMGSPIKIHWNNLGWKDKFNSPRFEWPPAFYIFFFRWQFCIWWMPPTKNEDTYWEMFLWWKYYAYCNLEKAESTWGWQDAKNGMSTWDKSNLK